MSHLIGSIEVGKLADIVLWKPAMFGAKPEMVLKGGIIAWSQMGDPNASIPTPQPVLMRPMFGSFGGATGPISVAFVSQACLDAGVLPGYGLHKRVEAVRRCRGIGKQDMKFNDVLPADCRRSGNLPCHGRRPTPHLRAADKLPSARSATFCSDAAMPAARVPRSRRPRRRA